MLRVRPRTAGSYNEPVVYIGLDGFVTSSSSPTQYKSRQNSVTLFLRLYFSYSQIKLSIQACACIHPFTIPLGHILFRHVGLYTCGYRMGSLRFLYRDERSTPLTPCNVYVTYHHFIHRGIYQMRGHTYLYSSYMEHIKEILKKGKNKSRKTKKKKIFVRPMYFFPLEMFFFQEIFPITVSTLFVCMLCV